MYKKIYLLIIFVLLIISSACKGDSVTQPTTDPGQIETQVAQEVAAQLTQIALSQPAPTMTTPPTATLEQPTDLPSPTNTSEPASPTPLMPTPSNTASAPAATQRPRFTDTPQPFACQLIKQKPENGKTFKPGANFDVTWTVKNIGTALWDDNEVDYRYESGDEIYVDEIYDLPQNVDPGESVDLLVEIETPDKEDEYGKA